MGCHARAPGPGRVGHCGDTPPRWPTHQGGFRVPGVAGVVEFVGIVAVVEVQVEMTTTATPHSIQYPVLVLLLVR